MADGVRKGSPDRIRPALRRMDGAERLPRRDTERQLWQGFGEAWTALSTLVSGIAVWGAIGYGLDRLAGTRPVLFVIGVLVGNFAGIYLIYVKSVRDGGVKSDAP